VFRPWGRAAAAADLNSVGTFGESRRTGDFRFRDGTRRTGAPQRTATPAAAALDRFAGTD
jgi:hypothetical protein